MKARVKATGDIVDVHRLCMSSQGDIWQKKSGREYFEHELDFDVKEPPKPRYNPDYWTRLEHQYAGMALQGIVASGDWDNYSWGIMAEDAKRAATALVKKLKNE